MGTNKTKVRIMLERDIEKYLVKKIKSIGGLSYKWTSPSVRGVPDRIVIYKSKVLFVELKAPNRKNNLSALQEFQINKLKENGAKVLVVASKEEVDSLVGDLLAY